ncbi:sodium:proton antiporter [Kaistia algarum]|uniref:cation:proton antiporter n=1 Tax=Kaistia algarum TaxID=2083279 RepID=UPI000CE879E7|nr:sodium:proton antiporter [Kaistia algarum]MCX5516753.1 sodium:proton antiporter [Kaistia algarum]PPE78645.1 sodium:proton antiporter [Kaistia algarum]
MLSIFELTALLLTLSAGLGWINHKFLPMSRSVGLLTMSVSASFILVAIDILYPSQHLFEPLTQALLHIDFTAVVMEGMLAFLLFAGALHVDLKTLASRAVPVIILATFATVVSTFIVGFLMWQAARLFGQPLTLPWALVFGALISPTDPVAVMSTLKTVKVPPSLEVEMKGEALFNDGVGIVIFTILLAFATGQGGEETSWLGVTELLVAEAGGGLLLGIATGYLAYRAMRLIDDYSIEVLITLALVTATYALARRIHVSGPLSVVAAGLLIGYRGPLDAMSDRTQTYVFGLWTLIDEVLNSLLFLLIGLEVLILRFEPRALLLAAIAIPIVVAARFIAVGLPTLAPLASRIMSRGNVAFLTWAGIRGGISIALALSIPEGEARPWILAATYAAVLFSVIVQGSTLGWVARRTVLARKSGV